jgi:geranylgeranyl diphosphate synthase type II
VLEVCEGQSLDKDFEVRENVSLKEYLVMIQKKTAALLETCCSIGAQLGGGSDEQVEALARFGRFLGMAFQLQDDLLDITAEEAEFGKVVGGDLVEGKKTFLFLKALEKAASREDKKILQKIIKDKGTDRSEIAKYKDLYCRLGIIVDTEKEILRFTNLALKEIKKIESGHDRSMLNWLAFSLLKRSK